MRLTLKSVPTGDITFKYEMKKLPIKNIVQLEGIKLQVDEVREGMGKWTVEAVTGKERDESKELTVNGAVMEWEGYLRVRLEKDEGKVRVAVKRGDGQVVS